MKLLPVLVLLVGCHSAESYLDAGTDGGGGDDDDAPDAEIGEVDLRTWTGTAEVTFVDLSGNGDTISAQVTWTPTTVDEDGVDYAASGTVTIARAQVGCTITIDSPTHVIGADDGYLRVDLAGTYRGFAGTFWDVAYTTQCGTNPPVTMDTIITTMWLDAATPRPLTGPDELTGDETMGQLHATWHFTR